MVLEVQLFYQLLFPKSRINFEAQLKNRIFFFMTAFACCPLHQHSYQYQFFSGQSSWQDRLWCCCSFCNFVKHTYILCSASTLSFLSKQTDLFPGVSGLWISSVCPGRPVHSCLSVVWQDWHREHLIWYVNGGGYQHADVGVYFMLASCYIQCSLNQGQRFGFNFGRDIFLSNGQNNHVCTFYHSFLFHSTCAHTRTHIRSLSL